MTKITKITRLTSVWALALSLMSTMTFARGGGGGRQQDDGFRAALKACHSETGTSRPERGSRPSQEDMQAMDSCMSAKGYERPQGGPPQGQRNDQDQGNNQGQDQDY